MRHVYLLPALVCLALPRGSPAQSMTVTVNHEFLEAVLTDLMEDRLPNDVELNSLRLRAGEPERVVTETPYAYEVVAAFTRSGIDATVTLPFSLVCRDGAVDARVGTPSANVDLPWVLSLFDPLLAALLDLVVDGIVRDLLFDNLSALPSIYQPLPVCPHPEIDSRGDLLLTLGPGDECTERHVTGPCAPGYIGEQFIPCVDGWWGHYYTSDCRVEFMECAPGSIRRDPCPPGYTGSVLYLCPDGVWQLENDTCTPFGVIEPF